MKKLWLLILGIAAVLLIGAITIGEKFVVNVFSWSGLSSDELIATDFTQPADMMNFEVGNEGGKTFLQKRGGFHQITPALASDSVGGYTFHPRSMRSAALYHLDLGHSNDRELIVVMSVDGDTAKFSACDRRTRKWYTVKGNISLGTDSTDNESFSNSLTGVHSNMVQYNSGLYATGKTTVFGLAMNSSGDLKRTNYRSVGFQRMLVHQDRFYLYSSPTSGADVTICELDWQGEFTTGFDSVGSCANCGVLWIAKGDGDYLTNVLSMGPNIVAFKTHSIYSVLVSPTSNAPSEVVRITDNLGCIAFDGAVAYNGIAYFVARDGVYSFDGSSATKLSDALNYWFADSLMQIDTKTSDIIKITVVANRIYAILPKRNLSNWTQMASGGFRLFVYDLRLGVWWKVVPGAYPITGSHFYLLPYNMDATVDVQYDSACGGPYYMPKVFIVADSAGFPCVYAYPNDGYGSDDGVKFTATYTTPMVPVGGSLWDVKQLDRAGLFGSALGSDSVRIYWYAEGNAIIDTTKFGVGLSPRVSVRRLPPTISGSLLKYQICNFDTLRVKINALELMGYQKGMKVDE